MQDQPRILAVGHDAFRAGAQIVFLYILRWLRAHHASELTLALTQGGDLLDDYASVLPTRVLRPRTAPTSSSRLVGLARRSRHRLELRNERWGPGSIDLVYANSVATAQIAAEIASEAGCPVICHVHELEMSMRGSLDPAQFRALSSRFARFIAVSRAVERNLVDGHGVPPERIDRIPGGIPLPASHAPVPPLPADLGVPADAFVVGGCGTTDWRKGPDLFVLIADALARRPLPRPVHFVWVGGEPGSIGRARYDTERLGLESTVHFVGEQADPTPFFARFDVFLLSSREDPFPLVGLEAAARGVPIVCFADAGGMPEFVEDDAGCVVPYLDLDQAATRLAELVSSECTRQALGRRAAEKVAQRCSIEVVAPQVAGVLDRCVSEAAP